MHIVHFCQWRLCLLAVWHWVCRTEVRFLVCDFSHMSLWNEECQYGLIEQKNKINFITLLRFNWHQIDSLLLSFSPVSSNFWSARFALVRRARTRTNTKFINYNSMNGFVHGISIGCWLCVCELCCSCVRCYCGGSRVRTLVGHVAKVKMCGRVWHCHRTVEVFFCVKRTNRMREKAIVTNSSFAVRS